MASQKKRYVYKVKGFRYETNLWGQRELHIDKVNSYDRDKAESTFIDWWTSGNYYKVEYKAIDLDGYKNAKTND